MSHVTENVCRFNKNGFCKYRDSCRYKHVNEVCEKQDCFGVNCTKRHPRTCRFHLSFGSCKFGENCKYHHGIQIARVLSEDNIDVSDLQSKIMELETAIKKYDDELNTLDFQMKDIIKKLADNETTTCETTVKNILTDEKEIKDRVV